MDGKEGEEGTSSQTTTESKGEETSTTKGEVDGGEKDGTSTEAGKSGEAGKDGDGHRSPEQPTIVEPSTKAAISTPEPEPATPKQYKPKGPGFQHTSQRRRYEREQAGK